MNVHKITLGSGKVVIMREPKISDTETAVSISGKIAGDNNALLNLCTQKELVKLLLVEVDGKALTLNEKESLDSLFTMSEYQQLNKVLTKIMGEEGNAPTIEFTSL